LSSREDFLVTSSQWFTQGSGIGSTAEVAEDAEVSVANKTNKTNKTNKANKT